MRRVLALVMLAALRVAPAAASEESQALAARAAIEIEAGRTEAAIPLLDRAVAADPYDAAVRYQRGVQRAKARAFDAALEDLRAAVAYRPDFPAAQLELGAALIETGQHREAIAPLLKAQAVPALEGSASYFLGVAYLRLNQLDDARESFDRAVAREPSLSAAVQYYRAVIDYRRGDLAAADTGFHEVQRTSPESAIGRESGRFLELIRKSRRAAYQAFGRVSFEYDSNVALAADDPTVEAVSPGGDGRFALNVGGSYVPWSAGFVRLAVGYEFFQSLHFNLSEFNLQDHRPALQLFFDYGRLSGGLLMRYDYYFRETDSFLQEGTGSPWVSFREEGFGRTDVYYRVQLRDYKQAEFHVLEGFYHEAGARQFVELGNPTRQLWVGYQFEANDPVAVGKALVNDLPRQAFKYDAHQLEAGLHWLLPYLLTLETGYRYTHQDYDPASADLFPPAGRRRRDHNHRVVLAFERPLVELSERVFVNVAYFGTFNDSNKFAFEYDRHIGSIGVEVRL